MLDDYLVVRKFVLALNDFRNLIQIHGHSSLGLREISVFEVGLVLVLASGELVFWHGELDSEFVQGGAHVIDFGLFQLAIVRVVLLIAQVNEF